MGRFGRIGLLLVQLLALVSAACSGGGIATLMPGDGGAVRGADNFQLTVLDDSFAGGGSAEGFALTRTDTADGVELSITAHNAYALKGLYASIAYDPRVWHAVTMDPLPEFGGADKLLSLSVLREPGLAWGGMVLQRYDTQPGYTGSGSLMRLRLARGAAGALRGVSSVPDDPRSVVKLDWDSGTGKLGWYFANSGDYNQNGKVELGDLAQVGIHYGTTAMEPTQGFPEDTALWVVDGSADGRISLPDVTTIAANWQSSILSGYNVYHSQNADDYPTAPTGVPDAAHLLGNAGFLSGTGGPAERKRFAFTVGNLVAGDYYWVRGCDGETDGIASLIAGGPSGSGDWPMYGRDTHHTHQSPVNGPQTANLAFKFRSTGPGYGYGTPVLSADSKVYACAASAAFCYDSAGHKLWEAACENNGGVPLLGPDGTLYVAGWSVVTAIDTTGAVKWAYDLPDSNYHPLCLDNSGNVVCGCADGYVYFITPGGTLDHSINVGDAVWSKPIVAPDGTLYAMDLNQVITAFDSGGIKKWAYTLSDYSSNELALAPDGTLYATDVSHCVALNPDGSIKWQFADNTDPYFNSPACDADSAVYFGDDNGACYKFQADGVKSWSFVATDNITSAPAIGPGGVVTFNCYDGTFFKLDSAGKELWRYASGSTGPSGSVIDASGAIYAGGGDGLYALTGDGALRWNAFSGGAFVANPALAADGTIYAPCIDGRLYALQPDGAIKWTYAGLANSWASPAVAPDGTVYQPCGNTFTALEPDGTLRWEYAAGDLIDSSPVLDAAGRIYFGCYDGKLYALNADGSLAWEYATPGTISVCSPALADDGTVYIGTSYLPGSAEYDGKLYALNPDGTLKWSYQSGGAIWSSPAIAPDGTVYFSSLDYNIYALNPTDGSMKWSFAMSGYSQGGIALAADGTVYTGSNNGMFYALNANGSLKWSKDNVGPATPAIGADGTVYTGSFFGGGICALNAADGSVKWDFTPELDVASAPTIAPDGTLYVGGSDGNLYAFHD